MDRTAETEDAKPIVHGDPENGFIVEHSDETGHRTHGCIARDEDDAISQAKRKWADDAKAAESDQAGDDTIAGAKGASKTDLDELKAEFSNCVDAMKAQHARDVDELHAKLTDHEHRFIALHDALAEMNKPLADAVETNGAHKQ